MSERGPFDMHNNGRQVNMYKLNVFLIVGPDYESA
jgi:hypothetical protein